MCSHLNGDSDGASSSGDDLWGADSDDGSTQRDLERERNARNNQFWNAGYRDGLDVGKEKTLQHGFDIGFRGGALAGFEWGALRAAVKTLEILCGQVEGTSQWRSQVAELSSQVEGVQPRLAMLGSFKQLLQQPMVARVGEHGQTDTPGAADAEELAYALARLNTSDEGGSAAEGFHLPGLPAAASQPDLPDMAAVCASVHAGLHCMGMDLAMQRVHIARDASASR